MTNAHFGVPGVTDMRVAGRLAAAAVAKCMPCQDVLIAELAEDELATVHMLALGLLSFVKASELVAGSWPSNQVMAMALARHYSSRPSGPRLVSTWWAAHLGDFPGALAKVVQSSVPVRVDMLNYALDNVMFSLVVEEGGLPGFEVTG